jgi:hypothetical protein
MSHLLVPQLGFLFGVFPPQAFHVLGWNRDLADLALSPVFDAMLGYLVPSCLCLFELFLDTGNE